MKTKQILLSVTLSLLLLACNSSSSKTDTTPEKNEKISVPKKIGVSIPKSLQKNRTNTAPQKVSDEASTATPSMGYMQLIDSISQLNSTKKEIEIELLVISHIMGDITQYCDGTPLDSTCTIPKGKLSLTLDNELVDAINEIEPNSIEEEGQTQILDKIEFTQYNETKAFQYSFKIFDEDEKSNSNIQWSKDEKHIRSAYEGYENTKLAYSSSINYDEFSNTNKKMTVNDSALNPDGKHEDFHFSITDKGNKNYTIKANDNFELGKFSSLGELSKKGGYLIFTGEYDGEKFAEKETFDAMGNLLSSSFCDSSMSCSLEDPTTWQASGAEEPYFEEDFNIDDTEEFEITPLNVTGGNLKGEYYFLLDSAQLPQDIGIDEMNMPMIEKAIVGEIYNFDGKLVASLSNSKYKKELNSLLLVEVVFNDNKEPTFNAVEKKDMPTLTIATSNEVPMPVENNESTAVCTTEYAPVCASVKVQCVTTPCEAVEQTFGNLCELNSNPNATYLRDGEC